MAFTSLFDDANRKSQIVGIFLAILELLRHHSFRAEQDEDFGEIWVMPPLSDASRDEGRLAEQPIEEVDATAEDDSESEADTDRSDSGSEELASDE